MRIALIGLLAVLVGGAATWAQTGPQTVPQPRPIQNAPAAEAPVVQTARLETAAAPAPSEPRVGPETGFPLPRYVSMRAGEGNARRGPSRAHRIDWVFTRRNMPMMIVAEYGHWRRVVDRDGAGGWMHYSLLSGNRSAIVEVDMLPLRARPDTAAMVRANAELGVTAALDECIPGWCLIRVGGYRGWVDASALWGVDPGEVFD